MTTTDHRAECHDGAYEPNCAECYGYEVRTQTRMLDQVRALLERLVGIADAAAAEAPEQTAALHAIRNHVVTEPRWIVPGADSLAASLTEPSPGVTPSTETERTLSALCDQLREERDQARTQIISLTGERDDLRDRVPADDEVVVKIAAPRDRWRGLAADLREVARCGRSEGFKIAPEYVDALASALRAALGGEQA